MRKKGLLLILLSAALVSGGLTARADWKKDANQTTEKAERKIKRGARKVKIKARKTVKQGGDKLRRKRR